MSNCRHNVNRSYCRVCKANKVKKEKTFITLTPQQLTAWRRVLSIDIGLVAFALSDIEIQRYHDLIQQEIVKLEPVRK